MKNRNTLTFVGLFAPFLGFLFSAILCSAQMVHDWTNWRGPGFSGNAGPTPLATTWSETDGIFWKTALPPWGNNTPVILGDSIFLTTHEDDERMLLLKLDKKSGEILWTREVATGPTPRMTPGRDVRGGQKMMPEHNLASPSVTVDQEIVIALFGTGDIAAYTFDGDLVWKENLQEMYGPFMIWWGYAASPLLFEDLIIIPIIQDDLRGFRDDQPVDSFVLALDKKTGKEVWRTVRNVFRQGEQNDSYSSPIIWTRKGEPEVLFMGGETFDAYNPRTGERKWWIKEGLGGIRPVPCPLPYEKEGIVFVVRGKVGPVCCFFPQEDGEQPAESMIWSHRRNTPDVATPIICENLLFFTDDRGVVNCVEPKTGEVYWTERLASGTYFPSLFAAGGNVYALNNDGVCSVFRASKTFEKIAENKLEGTFFSTPIASDGKLYIRSREAIYCIGNGE
ncbi:MAG: PQQ-binding-like beta-propeller repeat protein [Thermoguttaceae bacterium]